MYRQPKSKLRKSTIMAWGCVKCNDGYFKPNWDTSCLPCSNINGCNTTDGCSDFSGCNSCLNGYTRQYNVECGFNVCL